MNDDSALPATVTDIVVSAAQDAKLLVLDTDWAFGEHHLDSVATSAEGVLVVTEVLVAAPGQLGADIAELTDRRLERALAAGRAWISQHGTSHPGLWAVVATVDPGRRIRVASGVSAAVEVG